ncbi:hypothetical protein [Lutibacter aestuarii]
MKSIYLNESCSSKSISEFAKKTYKTYFEHYKSRNLTPMPLEEFIKNYRS